MANPLKILTALSASSGVAVSGSDGLIVQQGGLTVSAGNSTFAGTTITNLGTVTTADIDGGTIDGATIDTSNITVGAGKTLDVSAGTLTLGAGQVGADKISGATFNAGTYSFNGSTISDLGTVTTADINGGSIDGATIGASSQSSAKFTSISGSGALEVAGASTLAGAVAAQGGITVTGAALNASAVEVSASALNVAGAASVGGNLTVTGDLQVQGSLNAVNRTDLHVTDKVILVASGSANAAAADGAGLSVSIAGVDDPSFTYDQTGKWVSTENLDLASGKTFKINGTDVLSSTTLGSGIVNSSLTSVGTLSSVTVGGISTLSGTVLFKSNNEVSVTGAGIVLSTSSLNDLTSSLTTLFNSLSQVPDEGNLVSRATYKNLRSYSYAQKGAAASSVQFLLSGTYDEASGNGSAVVTASCPTNLSGANSGDVLNQLRFASFDVATKDQGSSIWTNDLVSVQIAETQRGSLYFPLVTVDAPALTSGAEIRLIVVYEATNEVM